MEPELIEVYQRISEHFNMSIIMNELERSNLKEKFLEIKTREDLFRFCVQWGFLNILKFLYENLRMSYNVRWIDSHLEILPGCLDNVKERSQEKGQCLQYLSDMRKWSRMTYVKGQGISYTYNPR